MKRKDDSACLLLSSKKAGAIGDYREPDSELSFRVFATQLAAHAGAAVKLNRSTLIDLRVPGVGIEPTRSLRVRLL